MARQKTILLSIAQYNKACIEICWIKKSSLHNICAFKYSLHLLWLHHNDLVILVSKIVMPLYLETARVDYKNEVTHTYYTFT